RRQDRPGQDRHPESLRPLDADREIEGVQQTLGGIRAWNSDLTNACGVYHAAKGGSTMAYETNGFNGSGGGPIHFTNVRILDAAGEYPYTGEVLIQGNRIKQITRGSSRP